MQNNVQVVFHGLDHSEAVENRILEKVGKLERVYGRITDCRVTVEAPHGHKTKGNLWAIKLDLVLPGGRIVCRSDRKATPSHQDVYVALRDTFDSARRRLDDFARKRAH